MNYEITRRVTNSARIKSGLKPIKLHPDVSQGEAIKKFKKLLPEMDKKISEAAKKRKYYVNVFYAQSHNLRSIDKDDKEVSNLIERHYQKLRFRVHTNEDRHDSSYELLGNNVVVSWAH
ncbi:MAG: hypothetical protein Q8R55_07490 [Candidatus Taylorbacteria bacterium]|nr:hypothetical protein [Candidatus Taylorbacteria bacterium]